METMTAAEGKRIQAPNQTFGTSRLHRFLRNRIQNLRTNSQFRREQSSVSPEEQNSNFTEGCYQNGARSENEDEDEDRSTKQQTEKRTRELSKMRRYDQRSMMCMCVQSAVCAHIHTFTHMGAVSTHTIFVPTVNFVPRSLCHLTRIQVQTHTLHLYSPKFSPPQMSMAASYLPR